MHVGHSLRITGCTIVLYKYLFCNCVISGPRRYTFAAKLRRFVGGVGRVGLRRSCLLDQPNPGHRCTLGSKPCMFVVI